MLIWCCECQTDIEARLTNCKEIYPHRKDLFKIPMWICDDCKNYVGCHYKTSEPTKPLGVIATKEIMGARRHIHAILDPIWKDRHYGMTRGRLYAELSKRLGYSYHTADIKCINEARKIYSTIKEMKQWLKKA